MASQPGLLTEWPWTKLGRFKYVVLAPWVAHSIYSFITKDEKERDATSLLIFPSMLWRAIHNQIWISVSRYRTAKGNNRIVDKSLEFEQVDRESNWDDQIILNAIIFYLGHMFLRGASHFPLWRTDGMILTMMLHAGPVEFIYYWIHRALHHHYLYSRYHSHHHSSIVTEPITSVIHPFAEHIVYFALFAIPLYTMVLTGTKSVGAYFVYITYIDLMNNMGHCNFELVPSWLFRLFPFLKYIMYTPSFHSLHHTQFRTNYSLFMPIYDYIYGTMDKSSNILYEKSLKRKQEFPDVVHLTHPTTLDSIYHVRVAFAAQAARPYTTKWYLKIFWPISYWSSLLASMYNHPFVVERNTLNQLKMQTWVIPRYSYQYGLSWQRKAINNLVEEAILKAEKAGVKVLSLGLLNQDRELNGYGALYVQKHPNLKIKIVDGSSLAVAIVLNNIPKETQEVLLRGNLCKVGFAIVRALCKNGVQVAITCRDEYEKLKAGGLNIASNFENNLVLSTSYTQKVWLVGDGLKEDEQTKAPKGTLLLPFSPFPPAKIRKDCIYCTPPAMIVPKTLENIDSCENWLPRRVMSAQRVAGIVHALANSEQHECGDTMLNVDEVWDASLRHGFRPLPVPTSSFA